MLLRERLETYSGRLTPADRAVLDVLLSHPAESAFLTADRITSKANVHVAAATRLAKKLGYAGYPHLRESLQTELLDGVGAADRIRNTLAHTETNDVLMSLVDEEVSALQAAARAIPTADIEVAARYVLTARRILLFTRGNATALGSMLERRLRRFGFDVHSLGDSDRDLAESLVSLTRGDLVIAVALRRAPRALSSLLAVVREAGATSILLTDTVDTTVRPRPDLVLAAPRGTGREYQSLTVPMAVANALVLTVASTGGARTMSALERLDRLLKIFGD